MVATAQNHRIGVPGCTVHTLAANQATSIAPPAQARSATERTPTRARRLLRSGFSASPLDLPTPAPTVSKAGAATSSVTVLQPGAMSHEGTVESVSEVSIGAFPPSLSGSCAPIRRGEPRGALPIALTLCLFGILATGMARRAVRRG